MAPKPRTPLRLTVTVLFVCGMAGIILTALFGFETPNDTLLGASAALLCGAALTVFVHLGVTRTLTRAQKRRWLRHLTGRKAAWAWSDYVTSDDLGAAALRLSEEHPRPSRSRQES
jgi:hypothetical protein